MTYLLDTNVVSEWAKPTPNEHVVHWLAAIDEDRVHLSVATFAELRRGIELLPKGRRRERLTRWVEEDLSDRFAGRVIAIDRRVAEAWGVLSVRAQRRGTVMSTIDAFLAATAAVHGLTLATRNVKDFEQAEVALIDPWQAAS